MSQYIRELPVKNMSQGSFLKSLLHKRDPLQNYLQKYMDVYNLTLDFQLKGFFSQLTKFH